MSANTKKQSERSKKLWQNSNYRKKCLSKIRSEETKKKIADTKGYKYPPIDKIKRTKKELRKLQSENAKKLWKDPKYREKIKSARGTIEFRKKMSENTKKLWEKKDYREKIYKHWAQLPKVSSVAKTFYSILDDLDIKYYREWNDKPDDKECKIGPYSWDCVIPRDGQHTLLIDINGDWSHRNSSHNDNKKLNYIVNNLSHLYEVKYIWQHELSNKDKVIELIKYWTGCQFGIVDYKFDEIKIKHSKAKEYRALLSKYHYLSNAGRGGISYGAYLHDKLIAVCVFSPLSRQNIHQTIGASPAQIRELSRFCIHPKYQKKNLGSWFISRCIKLLPIKYRYIITYADKTFNHNGTLYKSCNFTEDKVVRPDYWYYSADGWVMHKKTLYERAKNAHMKEKEFADKHGYIKVIGKEKIRFVLDRK